MEKERRKNRKVNKEAPFKIKNLCDGPSKLCQVMICSVLDYIKVPYLHELFQVPTHKVKWVPAVLNIIITFIQ